MGWWHDYIRKNTKWIAPTHARKWKTILSGFYFIATWNFFAFTFYVLMKEKAPVEQGADEPLSSYYARLLGTGQAKVYHYDGLRFVNEYTVTGEKTEHTYETLQENEEEKAAREN